MLMGFMNGVALLLLLTQVRLLLGLPRLSRRWSASTLAPFQPWALPIDDWRLAR